MVKIVIDVPDKLHNWLDMIQTTDNFCYEDIIIASMYYASKIGYKFDEPFINILHDLYDDEYKQFSF